MKVARTELATVIGERTLHVTDVKELTRELAAYLLSENRVSELESLMRDVLTYRQSHGIIEAVASSAHELGQVVEQEVAELLREQYPDAKQVIVRGRHDPELIGGLKVQLPNEQLDMSVRAKLATFKRLTTEGII